MRGKPQQPGLGVLRLQRKGPLLVRRAPRRELLGNQVAQARILAFPIVLDAPLIDLAARVVERNEDVLTKTFFAQAK